MVSYSIATYTSISQTSINWVRPARTGSGGIEIVSGQINKEEERESEGGERAVAQGNGPRQRGRVAHGSWIHGGAHARTNLRR